MRVLYLHGFASGPDSTKGVAFARHFEERGVQLERLNMRVPSFEHMRLSAMIEKVCGELGNEAIVIGSSLGGLTAARVAEREPRVIALVLLAPAFQLASRWREMLGGEYDEWQRTGWREVMDYTTKQPARVDFGFVVEAAQIDVGFPRVTVPTLVLHGVHDEVVPIETSRAFVAGCPSARLVELDDGHELVKSVPTLLAESAKFMSALGS
jgi:pimeloyl-ACP methyl ester carboxylesterase